MSDTGHVVSALEQARARVEKTAKPMLVFDADGTLWTGDVGLDLFVHALESSSFKPEARDALAAEAATLGLVSASLSAVDVARALFVAYEADRYDHARAYAMMAWAFAGFSEAEMLAYAELVLEKVRIGERLIDSSRAALEWAQQEGINVTICSASPRAVVEVGARHFGLAPRDVIAVTPSVTASVLQPRLVDGALPYAEGKVARLRSERASFHLLGAFGDSAADAHFMRLAEVPVAVQPSSALRALLPEIPRVIVA